jgi:hypothetical protein
MSTPQGPPSGFASDPQLIMLWTTPPDLTGMPGSGSESSTMPPPSDPFTVNLASVQAAEQAMLSAGLTVVTTYNPVAQEVQQEISQGTIFGQQATYNTMAPAPVPVDGGSTSGAPVERSVPDYNVPDTALQSAAQQAAEYLNPAMTRVLRLMADGMSTAGAYIAMLNNAGQIYTSSDKNSKVPPVAGGS